MPRARKKKDQDGERISGFARGIAQRPPRGLETSSAGKQAACAAAAAVVIRRIAGTRRTPPAPLLGPMDGLAGPFKAPTAGAEGAGMGGGNGEGIARYSPPAHRRRHWLQGAVARWTLCVGGLQGPGPLYQRLRRPSAMACQWEPGGRATAGGRARLLEPPALIWRANRAGQNHTKISRRPPPTRSLSSSSFSSSSSSLCSSRFSFASSFPPPPLVFAPSRTSLAKSRPFIPVASYIRPLASSFAPTATLFARLPRADVKRYVQKARPLSLFFSALVPRLPATQPAQDPRRSSAWIASFLS
ncbi:hypothetical protein CDD83_11085 [Cordyceps sp. RAO-2017]|nr:hypothetical protein CDD83_11085 [Cordyceps sp. RAO-2017]